MEGGGRKIYEERLYGMNNRKINQELLAERARADLLSYGRWDGKTRLKRMLRRLLPNHETPPRDWIFWPTGLLAAALWNSRGEETAQKEKTDAALAAYYGRWMSKGCPVAFLDDLLAGETLLSIYESWADFRGTWPHGKIGKEQVRNALDRLAGYAAQYPADETGSFPYRRNQPDYIFADTLGLACPFLYRYGTVFEKPEYQELAVRQIANYLAYGMDEEHNLPYHGYQLKNGCKYGIIGWGRAVGWLLRGMCGCMQTSYGRENLAGFYQTVMDRILESQREDGSFAWQLSAKEGPKDTSATAMIGRGLQEGLRLQVLHGRQYETALEQCREALRQSERNGRIYDCSGECEGFGQYPQRYDAYPWSLGPGMELLQEEKKRTDCK